MKKWKHEKLGEDKKIPYILFEQYGIFLSY